MNKKGAVVVIGGTSEIGKRLAQRYAGQGRPVVVTSRGVTLPAVSVDEYFAELAMWLGVSTGELSSVLPRINTFYTPSGSYPIGFMQV